MPLYKFLFFFYLTVSFKFTNFSFKIFLVFVSEYLVPALLTLFRLSAWFWFAPCNHYILAYFF